MAAWQAGCCSAEGQQGQHSSLAGALKVSSAGGGSVAVVVASWWAAVQPLGAARPVLHRQRSRPRLWARAPAGPAQAVIVACSWLLSRPLGRVVPHRRRITLLGIPGSRRFLQSRMHSGWGRSRTGGVSRPPTVANRGAGPALAAIALHGRGFGGSRPGLWALAQRSAGLQCGAGAVMGPKPAPIEVPCCMRVALRRGEAEQLSWQSHWEFGGDFGVTGRIAGVISELVRW